MNEGQSVAGTLYGCCAKDIVQLDPQALALRPPLSPVISAADEQEIVSLLLDEFTLEQLHSLARFSVGYAWRTTAADAATYAQRLAQSLVQIGPGMIDRLVAGAVLARPQSDRLKEFARTKLPYSLIELNDKVQKYEKHDANLVDIVHRALLNLLKLRPTQTVSQIIQSYNPNFRKTRVQIDILARYKELHNCLHEVQWLLSDVVREVDRLRAGEIAALKYLKTRSSWLSELAEIAVDQAATLESSVSEKQWIDELFACASDIETASIPVA
jgi:hypothetical protein